MQGEHFTQNYLFGHSLHFFWRRTLGGAHYYFLLLYSGNIPGELIGSYEILGIKPSSTTSSARQVP